VGTIDLLGILKDTAFITDFTDCFSSVASREILDRGPPHPPAGQDAPAAAAAAPPMTGRRESPRRASCDDDSEPEPGRDVDHVAAVPGGHLGDARWVIQKNPVRLMPTTRA
jgi:hypothetical protein